MERDRPIGTTPRWALAGLLFVFAFGLWLRLDGIDWLLPYLPEPDNVVALQLSDLEAGVPPSERMIWFQRYPLLLARLTSLWPPAEIPAGDDLAAHLRAASTVTLRVRTVNAVLASALVLATWSLSRRFVSSSGALLASAFVAASLLDVLFSQQARCHASQATLSTLAVVAALRLRAHPGWGSYALAGLCCGLALSLLQNGAATLLPLAAAHVLRERRGEKASWSGTAGKLVLSLAIVAGLASVFYAHEEAADAPVAESEFILDAEGIRARGHTLRFANFNGGGFPVIWRSLVDYEPALLALAALGFVLALPSFARWWKDKDLAVVLVYAIPYFIAVGLYRISQERFVLPLLPYLACLAAYAVLRVSGMLARLSRRPLPRAVLASVPVVGALALPVLAVTKFASVRDAPDTVEQAAQWIREHVDPEEGDILVTPALTMPLFHHPDTLDPSQPPLLFGAWVQYQAKLPPSAARGPRYRFVDVPPRAATKWPAEHPELLERYLEDPGPAYAVLEVSRRTRHMKLMTAIRERVEAQGERVFVAASEPEDPPVHRPLGYSEMPRMLARLLRVSCFGPRVEIWRLRKA